MYLYHREKNPDDPKFYDHIPMLLEKKYLKGNKYDKKIQT